ncbi:hypothetical protein B0I35DRAFT_491857 [Stachybotrys elegans]|uniref:Uncharacterized protein n=1 Tax=Stachybotrys elegans TaxID=80388 RepID=A0A8K0WLX3_9HYPO|nr:hypothetical protein B0I35DRAFT_491857 [Stachybotrys elegans]
MVVLLHKLEAWDTSLLLYKFSRFATLKLYKLKSGHAKRSSFYMIAHDIQSEGLEAMQAVKRWKEIWRIATFGTEEDYFESLYKGEPSVEEVLHTFGSEVIRLGKDVWVTQAHALQNAPSNK